ncbi:MAG: polysaccharide biosynthesis tyrosine autokinase, partial [Fibrobacter sp.]|nr:polysaccharide biosynthesis tyrosine autokinase [Fibrobacter sp.]
NMNQSIQSSWKDIDFSFYIRHYKKLLWRWKWYILLTAPLVAVIAFFGAKNFGIMVKPPLPATIVIGIDSPTSDYAFGDYGGVYRNKERLIVSRPFLKEVVDSLSLRLKINKHSRYEIIDSIDINSTIQDGTYHFKILNAINKSYKLLYSNKLTGIKDSTVSSGSLSNLSTIRFQGSFLKFTQTFTEQPFSFKFDVIPERLAIDNIVEKLKVTSPDSREQKYFFTASLEGKDYPLITQIVNCIGNHFIQRNLNIRNKRIKEVQESYKMQLASAENQLEKARKDLNDFLSAHPSVGLSTYTQQVMNELVQLETDKIQKADLLETAVRLKNKFINSEDKRQTTDEVIVFLQTNGSLAAHSLQNELTRIEIEREYARQNYSSNHPIFKTFDNRYLSLGNKAIQALESFSSQLGKNYDDKLISINKVSSQLRQIPGKEIQLAELQRKKQINSEIYTTLLSKYNETKVMESVDISDVYIMDYAVQPIPPPLDTQILQMLLIISACILCISFMLPLFMDFIDRTVRSEHELTRLLPYRFLGTIPFIKKPFSQEKKGKTNIIQSILPVSLNSNNFHESGNILLQNKKYFPFYTKDLFRSLATKVNLELFNKKERSIIVTAMNTNEGSTTISANLAMALAEQGFETVLIDANLRSGNLHTVFSANKSPGLSEYLLSSDTKVGKSSISIPIQNTFVPHLRLVSCGKSIQNPQSLFQSKSLSYLQDELTSESGFLIIDSPSIGITGDAAILGKSFSHYILVIKSGITDVINFRKIISNDYPVIGKKCLGTVLNMGDIGTVLDMEDICTESKVSKTAGKYAQHINS